MTRFLDGPATGVALMLQRAPLFLRAVQASDGTWDALDQLADLPTLEERIVAYRLVAGPWRIHVNRGRRGGCSWYSGGEYRVLEEQPPIEVLRAQVAWQRWCEEHSLQYFEAGRA